jgi:hypothetical protein
LEQLNKNSTEVTPPLMKRERISQGFVIIFSVIRLLISFCGHFNGVSSLRVVSFHGRKSAVPPVLVFFFFLTGLSLPNKTMGVCVCVMWHVIRCIEFSVLGGRSCISSSHNNLTNMGGLFVSFSCCKSQQ